MSTLLEVAWSAARRSRGLVALTLLAGASWLLVILAQFGAFAAWPLILLLLLPAAAASVWAWFDSTWFTRLAVVALTLLAALLYLPAAQHIALSGDAAIYPNEALYLARTGALSGTHDALAALSSDTRDLFYISSEEQFDGKVEVAAYAGLVYGGYYLADDQAATITSSRMPQTIAWMAFAASLAGPRALFGVNFVAAALALIVFFALGERVLARHASDRWIALWAAVLLAITYVQIYLARQPLSEIIGQVWTLAGFYAAVRWLEQRRPVLLVLAFYFWVTAWSARLDALLLLGPVGLLLIVAAHDRDRASLAAAGLAAMPLLLLAWLGNNRAYTASTRQLVFVIYDVLTPVLLALVLVAIASLTVAWIWGARVTRRVHGRLSQAAGWTLFGLTAFVFVWSTVPNPLRTPEVTRHWQEIPWFSSLYLSPVPYWLALAGFGMLLWRGGTRSQVFVIAAWLGLGAAYFYTYTTAPVYPIALRRLASDLLPLTVIVAGFALVKLPPWRRRLWMQAAVAVVALVWVGQRSWPLMTQHEARHDLAFVERLHDALPPDAAILFEAQDDDSWIGWLAAPLFSLYGDWALLLENDAPEPALLAQAVRELQAHGRTVLIGTQSPQLPPALLPDGHSASLEAELTWTSSLIGQTRTPWPPPYWEFDLPVNLYRLSPSAP